MPQAGHGSSDGGGSAGGGGWGGVAASDVVGGTADVRVPSDGVFSASRGFPSSRLDVVVEAVDCSASAAHPPTTGAARPTTRRPRICAGIFMMSNTGAGLGPCRVGIESPEFAAIIHRTVCRAVP
jgi:hypothetical protein